MAEGLTIDKLARATGMTVRNVRLHARRTEKAFSRALERK